MAEVGEMLSSCRARQLAEVEAIRAMYPEEGEFQMNDAEKAAFETLSDELDADGASSALTDYHLTISFSVHLLGTSVGGRHVSVVFSFPRLYPEKEAARVSVECGGLISRQQHEMLSLGAQETADEMMGNEAVLQVLQRVQDLVRELEEEESASRQQRTKDPSTARRSAEILERRVIWFHHIKSTQKRKDILEWGAELHLGGYCKPGFPGVLIFEGESGNVFEYVKRIQRLRWQAMQIRGQEAENLMEGQDFDMLRRFPVGIKELPESGMSELAARCRETNLESLFLTALKISK